MLKSDTGRLCAGPQARGTTTKGATDLLLDIRQLRVGRVSAAGLGAGTGERVLLAGPSGSGKSLFFRALADLIPWEGEVRLDGTSVHEQPAHQWRRRVMLVEADSAWWADQVRDHFPPDSDPPLEALGLSTALLDAAPGRISSGQRQRLAVLRALARAPAVLMLDEPTANLDETSTARLESLLRDWTARGGLLLMTSHEPAQQRRLATRFWQVGDDGQVREEGP